MAQYDPTVALGELKGSIGGTTFQGGNNSSIIRQRSYRRGSNTLIRGAATARLGGFATLWRGLSAADKLTWEVLATTYTFYNKFGRPYFGSAYQVYVSLNTYSGNLIGTYYATAPTPVIPLNIMPVTDVVISAARLKVIWTIPSAVNIMAKFYATAPMSAGRNDNNPKLRFIASIDITALSELNIYADYILKFPFSEVGQKIIVKMAVSDFNYPYPYFPQVASGIMA